MKAFANNPICRMLGIDLPIVGAPMFLVSYPELVVAVSNAGGIGTFPSANYRTLEEMDEAMREIRALTDRPIGVNIILHEGHNPAWRGQFDTALRNRAELIIFSLGVKRDVVREAQAAGAKVFFDVTTLRHAKVAAKSGVDAIIAVSQGAGGHAGTVNPFSLIPELKAAPEISVPVLAAGAISSGAQMAAALCLGADAVYVGTRLIATPEARAAQAYKQMILESSASDIVYSGEISGIPANWLGPSYNRWKAAQTPGTNAAMTLVAAGDHAGHGAGDGGEELKRWRDIWSAGQGVAQIQSVEPAGDIVAGMARDCERILRALATEAGPGASDKTSDGATTAAGALL